MSADDNDTLVENAKNLKQTLETSKQDITQLSLKYSHQNKHLKKRKAFASESKEEIINLCASFINNCFESKRSIDVGNIVFVFCEVGTVWHGMCSWFLKNEVFTKTLDTIDKHLSPLTGWKIREKLASQDPQIQTDPMIGHISIFACQVSLFEVWQYFGIQPTRWPVSLSEKWPLHLPLVLSILKQL